MYDDVAVRHIRFTDTSRPTQPAFEFPGSPSRQLDTIVWSPADSGGAPFPLIIYSHGTYGAPDNASHITRHLAAHGYLVAAPAFPLTASTAHTRLPAAHIADGVNQPGDVSFVIEQLLADPAYARLIDPEAIGATGHSLGGVTSYFLAFGEKTREPRIKATGVIAGGDPVASLSVADLGFDVPASDPVSTPVLFLS